LWPSNQVAYDEVMFANGYAMRVFLRSAAVSALLAATLHVAAQPALSADLTATPADPWTGFYIGAQAGYLDGAGEPEICSTVAGVDRDCTGLASDYGLGADNPSGGTAGTYLGFNYRIDSMVLGIEGDVNWDDASDDGVKGSADLESVFGPQDVSLNWDASVRARIGVVVGERAMLYATGGPSWINVELKNDYCNQIAGEPGIRCGDESTELGLQLGVGAEFLVTDNLSVKAEYLHGWYGDTDLNVFTFNDGVDDVKFSSNQNLQTNVFRAGVAWHFGNF
jgi:outer membrane immunogenic protein